MIKSYSARRIFFVTSLILGGLLTLIGCSSGSITKIDSPGLTPTAVTIYKTPN